MYDLQQRVLTRDNLALIVSSMLKAQHRLEHAYVRLDKALKSAQKRLPTSLIDSWKQQSGGATPATAWSRWKALHCRRKSARVLRG